MKKQKVDEVDSALDAKIEKQNKKFYELRDQLESQTKKPVHISILEANQQAIPEGNSEVNFDENHNIPNIDNYILCVEFRCWIMLLMLYSSVRLNHATYAKMGTSCLAIRLIFARAIFQNGQNVTT